MKKIHSFLKNDPVLFWCFSISFVLLCISLSVILIFIKHLPPLIPIYNAMPWGYTRLGNKIELFIPTSIGIFFLIINIFLSRKLWQNSFLLARFLGVAAFFVALCVCVFSIKTIVLVY